MKRDYPRAITGVPKVPRFYIGHPAASYTHCSSMRQVATPTPSGPDKCHPLISCAWFGYACPHRRTARLPEDKQKQDPRNGR